MIEGLSDNYFNRFVISFRDLIGLKERFQLPLRVIVNELGDRLDGYRRLRELILYNVVSRVDQYEDRRLSDVHTEIISKSRVVFETIIWFSDREYHLPFVFLRGHVEGCFGSD